MSIKIISWNANSISAHSSELKLYIQNCRNKPHVICIQESWLHDKSKFNIHGYNLEMKNRKVQRRGGVATLIKSEISYEVIDGPSNDLESLSIRIKI